MSDKKTFERPFIGTSVFEGITLLFSKEGSYSTILEIRNKALQHAADPSDYEAYHQLLGQCIKSCSILFAYIAPTGAQAGYYPLT